MASAKPYFSTNQLIVSLTNSGGSRWDTTTVTYALAKSPWFTGHEARGAQALSDSEASAVRTWIDRWDALIATSLREIDSAAEANIRVANTTTGPAYAYAYFPGETTRAGSVWFNPKYGASAGENSLTEPISGCWGDTIIGHELGHAFGLSHPGTYNGGSPSYNAHADHVQDSQMYTVMSYFRGGMTGADWIDGAGQLHTPQTPMMDDVLAIQAMYGADPRTRIGDTRYRFGSTADDAVFNFEFNRNPVLCVFDAGGQDVLDLSGFNTPTRLDLNPGQFSDAAQMTRNVSIAREVWIEDGVTGTGCDTLIGNRLNNRLDGGAGADWMGGGAGDDHYVVDHARDRVVELVAEGTDRIEASISYSLPSEVEHLVLVGQAVAAVGNAGANWLMGQRENNVLDGAGGVDTLWGGLGADRFIWRLGTDSPAATPDLVLDFSVEIGDQIDLSALDGAPSKPGIQSLQWINHRAFSGTAGELRFDAGALAADLDGNGLADFQVLLAGVTALPANALIL